MSGVKSRLSGAATWKELDHVEANPPTKHHQTSIVPAPRALERLFQVSEREIMIPTSYFLFAFLLYFNSESENDPSLKIAMANMCFGK